MTTIDFLKGMFMKSLTALEQTRPEMDMEDAEYVVFDTELTGLNPRGDSIVSIGALIMEGGMIQMGRRYSRVVSPRTELSGRSVCIHGIMPSEAAECPGIERILPEFLEFCGNRIVVGHFVSIDLGFINAEMRRMYGGALPNAALDTLALHRRLGCKGRQECAYYEPTGEDMSLGALAGHYGIPVGGAHDALMDAFVTAQVFQRMLVLARRKGINTVRGLLRAGAPA